MYKLTCEWRKERLIMNNMKIEEVEKRTIRDAKAEVVRLRILCLFEPDPRVKDEIAIKLAEARLWQDIAETPLLNGCELERIHKEEAKTKLRKMVKRAFIAASVAALLVILLFAQGCRLGGAVGMDCEVFYPKVETSKGGKFGDPDESRKQSTQHTIGMARNNLPMVGQGGAE